MNLTAEQIYMVIKEKTDLSDQQIEEEREKIKQKYQGLLSEVGANIMLAKKLNITLETKTKTTKQVTIKEITTSLDSVSLYARIKSLPLVKKYKAKDGSDGKIQAVYVFDDTGLIKLNLWNEQADVIKEKDLKKNDLIYIKDAFVNEYNNKTELSLRQGGEIIKEPQNPPSIKKLKDNFIILSDINKATEEPITTLGRIISLFPKKTFDTKDNQQRSVLNFNLSDGLKTIKVVAWSPYAEEFESNYEIGDVVFIYDAIVKDGLYDLEIHLNWTSSIVKNPKTDLKIPELSALKENDYQQEEIQNIKENNSYKIKGVVVAVNRNALAFYKCPECNSKVHSLGEDFICETCNKAVEPKTNVFGSIEIDDSTGILKVTMFGNVVEKFYNINKDDYKKGISDEDKDELFSYLEDQLLGKKVVVCGRAKRNDFSGNVEMMADTVSLE